jgi:hypothetical protein
MTVLTRPSHALRLAGLFATSVAVFGLFAAAAGAVLYMIDNERGVSRPGAAPTADIELPPGLTLVHRIDGPDVWEERLGFAPVMPKALPDGVRDDAIFLLQPDDEGGWRAGHIRFAGDAGVWLVLVEQYGALSSEEPTRTIETDETLAYVGAFSCGPIILQPQVYVSRTLLSGADAEAIAEAFVSGLREQCRGE